MSEAAARLKQYLEQRRDLGESEFVLDSMSVDDALHILGAMRNTPLKRHMTVTPSNAGQPVASVVTPRVTSTTPPLPDPLSLEHHADPEPASQPAPVTQPPEVPQPSEETERMKKLTPG